MKEDLKDIVEFINEGFLTDMARDLDTEPVDKKAITFWIPEDYKRKYEQIQDRSKKKLGKNLAKLIIMIIDKAEAGVELKSDRSA